MTSPSTSALPSPMTPASSSPTAPTSLPSSTPHSPSPLSQASASRAASTAPLLISAHFSLPSDDGDGGVSIYPSFSIQIKSQIGYFSFKKTTISSSSSNPNQNPLKEDGDRIYHPLPLAPRDQLCLEDLLPSSAIVPAMMTLPIASRATLKLRWEVNFSTRMATMAMVAETEWRALSYPAVEKISIETVENERRETKKLAMVGIGDWNLETMKDMCF